MEEEEEDRKKTVPHFTSCTLQIGGGEDGYFDISSSAPSSRKIWMSSPARATVFNCATYNAIFPPALVSRPTYALFMTVPFFLQKNGGFSSTLCGEKGEAA